AGGVFEDDSGGRQSTSGGALHTTGVRPYVNGGGQEGFVAAGVGGRPADMTGHGSRQRAIGADKASACYDPAGRDPVRRPARTAPVDTSNDDKRVEFSWNHDADTWLNEVQLTYEHAFYVPQITNGDVNGAVYTWFDGGQDKNVLAVDGAEPRAGQNKGQKGWAIGDTLTFSDISWGSGVHNIKAGVKYKDVDLTAADSIPGNPVFYYDVTTAGTAAIPWKSAFALPLA